MVFDVFKGIFQFKEYGIWVGQIDRNVIDFWYVLFFCYYYLIFLISVNIKFSIIGYFFFYIVKIYFFFIFFILEKIIYYEVVIILVVNFYEICFSLGFIVFFYLFFWQFGWYCGLLVVYGDDGYKFINDWWGGKDFMGLFRVGERYGIGIIFIVVVGRMEMEIFFMRNGLQVGRWNLYEEGDLIDLFMMGLEGYYDLSCVVGIYGGVGFEVIFRLEMWLFLLEGYYFGKRGQQLNKGQFWGVDMDRF